MKTKRFSKKLDLNKVNIANLDQPGMQGVKGGGTDPLICDETLFTCEPNCTYATMCNPTKCPTPPPM